VETFRVYAVCAATPAMVKISAKTSAVSAAEFLLANPTLDALDCI
jgi:hypothetical protein